MEGGDREGRGEWREVKRERMEGGRGIGISSWKEYMYMSIK